MKNLIKKASILIISTIFIIQLVACGRLTAEHQHEFSSSWQSNELLHWQSATCKHTELTRNLGTHTLGEDGKCTVCGYRNSTFKPTPVAETDKYYLPQEANDYVDDELTVKQTYTYAENLHGFTETKNLYFDDNQNYDKDVNTYTFNDDYTKLTLLQQEFSVTPQKETLTSQRKYEYEFFENSSFKVRYDDYDLYSKEYVFQDVTGKFYNEKGQMTLYYVLKPSEENEERFYYYLINVYEYDDDGFIQRESYFSETDNLTYLEYFSVYEYNENHTSFVEKDYYYSDTGYYQDGYTEMTAEIKDGIRYETEIIHNQDGSLGNTNKFGYDENGDTVYIYYGGIPEESKIVKNPFNQIIKYSFSDDGDLTTMEVTYAENGGNILSSTKDRVDGSYVIHEVSTYDYSESGQITMVTNTVTGSEEFIGKTTVTYTQLQNDKLLKVMELYDSIIRNYSDNVLVEGL